MDTVNSSPETIDKAPSPLRIAFWAIGWVVSIAGALSLFSVPLYLTFLSLVLGTVTCALAYRSTPAMTWRSWFVLVIGSILIMVILSLFGEERIRRWIPHPAGYIPAWFGSFHAFRQLRHLLHHQET